MPLELYASPKCPFCAEVRARLEWEGDAFVEYDVDSDADARMRFAKLGAPDPIVPLLVEDGHVVQRGVGGRGCTIGGIP